MEMTESEAKSLETFLKKQNLFKSTINIEERSNKINNRCPLKNDSFKDLVADYLN